MSVARIRSDDIVYSVERVLSGTWPDSDVQIVRAGFEAHSGYTPGDDDADDPVKAWCVLQWVDFYEPWETRANAHAMAFTLRVASFSRRDINDPIGALRFADRLADMVRCQTMALYDRSSGGATTIGRIVINSAVATTPGIDERGVSTALCEIDGWAFLT